MRLALGLAVGGAVGFAAGWQYKDCTQRGRAALLWVQEQAVKAHRILTEYNNESGDEYSRTGQAERLLDSVCQDLSELLGPIKEDA